LGQKTATDQQLTTPNTGPPSTKYAIGLFGWQIQRVIVFTVSNTLHLCENDVPFSSILTILSRYFNVFEVQFMNLEREDIELGNTVDEKSGCGLWGCCIN
jgi:hypothetical protein